MALSQLVVQQPLRRAANGKTAARESALVRVRMDTLTRERAYKSDAKAKSRET